MDTEAMTTKAEAADAPSTGTAPFGTTRVLSVVTHHKTGTVWLKSVFLRIGKALGINFRFANRAERHPVSSFPEGERVIIVNGSGEVPPDLWERDDYLVLHMIRDPRDVLISGMRFHRKVTTDKEPFLHRPMAKLGGLTYQQHLNQLPDDDTRLIFEMENRHDATVREMRAWDYRRSHVVEWRYEDLIADRECRAFTDALRSFARSEEELARMRRIFWRNSLFGSLSRKRPGKEVHIASGESRQWVSSLPLKVARQYRDRHGEDLIALGYEKDLNWVSELESASEGIAKQS